MEYKDYKYLDGKMFDEFIQSGAANLKLMI